MVFPRKCVGCGRHGNWLCADCAAAVHWLTPPLCDCCGREVGAGSRCQECARDRPKIDGIRACSRFEGAIRQAIHRLKYGGQRALAEPLAELLVQVARQLPPADAVVPVPLHPARERRRGYNQSALLAAELGRRLDLPLELAARRVRETRDQVELDRRARQANVKGAFACADLATIAGRRLLLIDDVCTTGSTLLACAEPLVRAGAASVWGLTIARQDEERT